MAFLAKQFMSLLLLLIISRLILSTHAGRQHFSKVLGTPATTATNNYDEFSRTKNQPAFYLNKDEQHGFGTPPPPSFLPSNYDPVMYTTSKETQKNTYNQEKAKPMTVAERFGATNEQTVNTEEMPTTSSEKQTVMNNQFYYRNKYNKAPIAKQFYYKDKNYDKFGGKNWKTEAAEYRSRYNNKAINQEDNEEIEPLDLEEEMPNQFYSKDNKENYFPDQVTVAEKYYLNNEETYSNSKYDEQYNKWINGENQQYKTFTPPNGFRNFAKTDEELNKLLDQYEVKTPANYPYGKRQGMSDTRNSFDPNKYANAFSGNALSNAIANQNP